MNPLLLKETLVISINPRHGAGASATIGHPTKGDDPWQRVMWLGPTTPAHTIAHEIGHVFGMVSSDDRETGHIALTY